MAGLGDPKVMVVINNDPRSLVFEKVDRGVLEGCGEFVPRVIEKIKQHKGISS